MRSIDWYGLRLSTSPEAAAAYRAGQGRILRVQSGADEALRSAVAADPGFAVAHAALALLGHEYGAPVDVPSALAAACLGAARRGTTTRERDQVAAIVARIRRPGPAGARAVLDHIRRYPRDALMVSVAAPTIAFSGVTEVPQEAWRLVEDLAPAYGDDWWYAGLLAFVRQEQSRWTEAAALAQRSLAAEPASGHAVHAWAHVHYETGEHAAGLRWLDRWIGTSGLGAHHRVHFSWHAALHELAAGDGEAVRRRYATQLAPPHVAGVRALVDSASLRWRGLLEEVWRQPAPELLAVVDPALLARPRTGFVALHAAVALAVAGDEAGLGRLAGYARSAAPAVFPAVVAPLADGLRAYVAGRFGEAADLLAPLGPALAAVGGSGVGGSAAQREVVEDTLLHALLRSGRTAEARGLLAKRLDRRPSRRDLHRLHQASGPVHAEILDACTPSRG
jgi:hypothetical protein